MNFRVVLDKIFHDFKKISIILVRPEIKENIKSKMTNKKILKNVRYLTLFMRKFFAFFFRSR